MIDKTISVQQQLFAILPIHFKFFFVEIMSVLMVDLLSKLNKSLSTAVPKLAHLGYQWGVVKKMDVLQSG